MKTIAVQLVCCLALLSCARVAAAQCVEGPDAQSRRALQTAFEAQSAISDHLRVAALDRESRELTNVIRDDDRGKGALTAQATLNFAGSSVRGFSVCDASDWQAAKLSSESFGMAAGIGARGIARVELRLFGIGDSVIQRDLADYYPEREAGAESMVPGAIGAGHGLWSARLEVLEHVSLTVGRVSSHSIEHSVGWDEDTDEDGNTEIVKSHTAHWYGGGPARTFFALGSPKLGVTDLVIGNGALERVHAGTPWIVPRPRHPVAAFRVDGGYDGLLHAPLLGADVMPLGVFEHEGLPTFRVRGAAELKNPALREASVGARWGYSFARAGVDVPGDIASLDLSTGMFGSSRMPLDGPALVPGVQARADFALPIYAVLRLGTWAAVNRPETIVAIPDTVNRPEWGLSLYATYSL